MIARSSDATIQLPINSHDDAVGAAVADLPPITLAEVQATAELQQRIDRKYLLPVQRFDHWLHLLDGSVQVLQIAGRRTFGYESTYFDTADLLTFRQHRQGRRRRFKIRTRTYTDTDECVFEVKLEGRRDTTVKERMPYPVDFRDRLTDAARR
ncbi:VTC domain-containing protein [Microlunatus elymi]|uniref:VTC domain-containing protein n=1 Tax=Microlunatus elymi TaxID=2596828 RepID=A0A516PXR2_9ACTN|nr:VTC domain-containing protein [Microlunatus elymi]